MTDERKGIRGIHRISRTVRRGFLHRLSTAFLALATLVGGLTLSACGNEATSATGPKIRIGIKFDQPGLSVNDGGHYSGFDIDVATYVARKLGYSPAQIEWKEAPSNQREALLQNGSVNMVIGTYSITADRKKIVDFAGPYFIAGQGILIRKDESRTIRGAKDLPGKRVCTASGSTPAAALRKYFPTAQRMELSGYAECVTALESGTVDAVSTDDIILATLAAAKGDGNLRVVGKPFTKECYGIGVPKNSPHLVEKINQALREMVSSGVWRQDLDKAIRGTGYKPNSAWNPPTRMDAEESDERVRL